MSMYGCVLETTPIMGAVALQSWYVATSTPVEGAKAFGCDLDYMRANACSVPLEVEGALAAHPGVPFTIKRIGEEQYLTDEEAFCDETTNSGTCYALTAPIRVTEPVTPETNAPVETPAEPPKKKKRGRPKKVRASETDTPVETPTIGDNSGPVIREFFDRFAALDEARQSVATDIKDLMVEVKAAGINAQQFRKAAVLVRRDQPEAVADELATLELYLRAMDIPV